MTPDEFKNAQATLGLTNAQLAEELGVSESTVVKWRGDQHPIPKAVGIALRALTLGGMK